MVNNITDIGGVKLTEADKSLLSDMDMLPEDRPKRRGRPPGSTNKEPSERKQRELKSYYPQLIELIKVPNSILAGIPATHDDALSDEEVHNLAIGIDAQQKVSPRFRKGMVRAIEGTGTIFLATVCVGIALPRLARHGLIPMNVFQNIEEKLKQQQTQAMTAEEHDAYMQSMMHQGNVETR